MFNQCYCYWHGNFEESHFAWSVINRNQTGEARSRGTQLNMSVLGIGSFTIVDGKVVTGSDVGNNFFLEEESIGKSRAHCTLDLLRELNEDVQGNAEDRVSSSFMDCCRVMFLNSRTYRIRLH